MGEIKDGWLFRSRSGSCSEWMHGVSPLTIPLSLPELGFVTVPSAKCVCVSLNVLFNEVHAKDILLCMKLFPSPPSALTMEHARTRCTARTVWMHLKLVVICTSRWGQELETLPRVDAAWLRANALGIRVPAPVRCTEWIS